ncbi:DNA repair and recombination protein rhm52 [Podosphaera aphanis]|nr:DNA repair and recombination protein rhm52 [Podosphaera aphanis]
MPALGDQHLMEGKKNSVGFPYEEPKRQVSAYTAQEIATLQARLEKKLGPEYLSCRSGPGGQKMHYITADKCIQLANEVFGFNGWSSQIMACQVDFVDENPQTCKVSLGLSVIVRVTLKDGTFHEDIGYGHIENCRGKAMAFEKSKKEGTTDALKRALRNFGNVLGNCIYDTEYLKRVTKVKKFVPPWSEDDLFRHSSFVGLQKPKESLSLEKVNNYPIKNVSERKKVVEPQVTLLKSDSEECFDDEFGDFDEADFGVSDPDCHPDEVALSDSTPPVATNQPITNNRMNEQNTGIQRQSQSVQAPLPRPSGPNVQKNVVLAPQTPMNGQSKANSNSVPAARPDVNHNSKPTHQISANLNIGVRNINHPSRMSGGNHASTTTSSEKFHGPPSNNSHDSEALDTSTPTVGFYSARAASLVPPPIPNQNGPPTGPPDPLPLNAPVFNPHAESPSIRKTPGIDHKSSKPLTRDLRHVPSASQAHSMTGTSTSGGIGTGLSTGNILNPSLDNMRRIGAPGSPSPNTRGTGFRMPMKRPTDPGISRTSVSNVNRVPLEVLSANSAKIDGVDSKRQKLHG